MKNREPLLSVLALLQYCDIRQRNSPAGARAGISRASGQLPL
jgi:hypothetical protein